MANLNKFCYSSRKPAFPPILSTKNFDLKQNKTRFSDLPTLVVLGMLQETNTFSLGLIIIFLLFRINLFNPNRALLCIVIGNS